MKVSTFRSLLRQRKFYSFTIVVASGDRFRIGHPETLRLDDGGEVVAVLAGRGDVLLVDVTSIVAVLIHTAP